MSEGLVEREEIEALMWNVVDTLTYVRDIHRLFFGDDDEDPEEEGDG